MYSVAVRSPVPVGVNDTVVTQPSRAASTVN